MESKLPLKYNEIINLAMDTIDKNKQALIFVNTKSSAEKQAEDISKKIKNIDLEDLSYEISNALSNPTKQCKRLSDCVKRGIAFHHSGLSSRQRELIEDNFRNGLIKIICCTPTLAAGLNLPAYRAIIKDLKRFTIHGMQYIPVLEYLQMAGRAGRPKFDTSGEAICIAKDESNQNEIYEKYILGKPEEIYSKLSAEPVLRTYVLSLISSELVKDKKTLIEFFKKTFYAHQYKDIDKLVYNLMKVIKLLVDWDFIKIESSNDYFVSADSSDEEKYSATLLGKRISELYLDPYTANKLIEGLKEESPKMEFSYLHLISKTLEMRPLLRITKADSEIMEEKIELNREFIIEDEDYFDDYYTFLSSIKTAFFLEEWINEKDEDYLLTKFRIRPGEINYKIDIGDWLLYSCHELANLLMLKNQLSFIVKLRLRLKYGVKEELLPLINIKLIGKVRARKLYDAGIKNVRDLKKTDLSILKRLIGEKTAVNIKKQLLMS